MPTTATNGDTTTTTDDAPVVQLRRIQRELFEIPIRGVTPLIVNRFDEKAKQMMLEAQQTKARTKKPPKDPVALFEASRYLLPDGRDGFPAVGFKAAIVDAARFYDGVNMTDLRRMIYVAGEGADQLVPLDYDELTMREDAVRNATGVADLRYRAQYIGWTATLRVQVIAGQFDHQSVLHLVDAAGNGGVGEWRPSAPKSKTGTYGVFEVVEG